MPNDTLSGDDLRLMRLARRLTAVAVARHYGVTPSRVTNIESSAHPTRRAVRRYFTALRSAERDPTR